MRLLAHHWSLDPFLAFALAVAGLHELGLRHLAARSRPQRTRARRRRALFFYGGLAVLVVTVESPLDYWAGRYFSVHMVEHLLLMFAAPMLIVFGGPWVPLVHGFPVGVRRRAGRWLMLSRRAGPLRGLGRVLASPLLAIAGFNAVMVLWHLPGPFDLAERSQIAHVWLMHASFFGFGVLFWLQFIRSHPFRVRLSPARRMEALFLTNTVMFVLALSMSFFATGPWYSVYAHPPGRSLSPFEDQQLGAAILWVCGDFWCLPTFIRAAYDYIRQDRGQRLRPLVLAAPTSSAVTDR